VLKDIVPIALALGSVKKSRRMLALICCCRKKLYDRVMANSIVRIDLHNANEADFHNLEKEMVRKGFSRTVLSSTGDRYELPTGLFHILNEGQTREVLFAAQEAARATQKTFGILVTDGNIAWDGLTKLS
jgi:hypothetical protein